MHTLTTTPSPSLEAYRARRRRVAERMDDNSALLLHGGLLRTRSNDTEFRFRPDSNFHYLSGLREPGALLLLRPGHDPEFTLFVRPRDPQAEIWTGRRVGPQGAIERYGAEHHELAGRAKDMGSAAVFVLMMSVILVWALVLGPRYL